MTFIFTVEELQTELPFHIFKSKRTPIPGDTVIFQNESEEQQHIITHVHNGNGLMKSWYCVGWVTKVKI
jgi:hypothetical protein